MANPSDVSTPSASRQQDITLEMGDVLPRIPPQFLKEGPVDAKRRLRFRVSDLFPGISRGRVSVPLEQIARQCPEFFRDRAEAPREFQVHLPLQKVVEQIGVFPARAAQAAPAFPANTPPVVAEKNTAQHAPAQPGPPAPAPLASEKIHLSLATIARNLPGGTFRKPVAESARVSLPLALIELQLAKGRVELTPAEFADALAPDMREAFVQESLAAIPIPLDEVFNNLPGAEPEPPKPPAVEAAKIPVPSPPPPPEPKAQEKPLPEPAPAKVEPPMEKTSDPVAPPAPAAAQPPDPEQPAPVSKPPEAGPIPPPAPGAKPAPPVIIAAPEPVSFTPAIISPGLPMPARVAVATPPPPPLYASLTAVMRPPLRASAPPPPAAPAPAPVNLPAENATLEEIFATREPLDLDRSLELISDMAGIAGCIALFGRDLRFAGAVPAGFDARPFRDTVWAAFQSVTALTRGCRLGEPASITLDAGVHTATLFTVGDAALLVFHAVREFQPGVREKLCAATRGMARML